MVKKENKSTGDGIKKITQDVNISDGRRSIRDIPIPGNGGVIRNKKVSPDNDQPEEILSEPPKDKSRYFLWGIVFISIIVLVFAISSLFSGATVTIVPRQQNVTLDDVLVSAKDSETLAYQTIQISDTVSKGVESDSEEYVESSASGQIVIFNSHSSSDQRLIAQTRFESPDGKIYRIQEPVVVPGMEGDTPGQLEVTVYADEPGEEYNIGLTDFTIPGFAGDPRFETFFARSKTAMTGGFAGNQPVISDDAKNQAQLELREILKERLTNELAGRVSDSLIIPENSTSFVFETLPVSGNSGQAEVVEKGTVRAIALGTSSLASRILEKSGQGTSLEVKIDNLPDINVSLENSEEFNPVSDNTANIRVTGDAHLVWAYDSERVKKDLAGVRKAQLSEILSGYDEIEKARAVVRPFWKRSFPSDPSEIKVKTELD